MKLYLGFVAAAVVAILAFATSGQPAAAGGSNRLLPGDVNCDFLTNSVDAVIILQFDTGLISGLPCKSLSDLNQDYRSNSLDAVYILQMDTRLIVAQKRNGVLSRGENPACLLVDTGTEVLELLGRVDEVTIGHYVHVLGFFPDTYSSVCHADHGLRVIAITPTD